jgi:hypothetical protein
MKRRDQLKEQKQQPGGMIARAEEPRVIRGGKEVDVTNEELRKAYQLGLPVLPPRIVMVGNEGPGHDPAIAVILDKLVRVGSAKCFLSGFFEWPSEDGLGNAHEVAEGLMLDLLVARQADGWVLVTGDIRVGNPPRYSSYSWLEYDGWVVEAAQGLVKIYKKEWFYGVFQPRRVVAKDARQMREEWKRRGAPELVAEMDKPAASGTAKVYDLDTKTITEMPVSELAPGMALAQVVGVEGPVWVDATKLTTGGTNLLHPPFPPEMRQETARIARILKEVDPRSAADMEESFRGELCPEKQIFIYGCIAEAYERFAAGNHLSLLQRSELYRAIIQATMSTKEAFLSTVTASSLSKAEIIQAGNLFWRLFDEKGGDEKSKAWDATVAKRLRELTDGPSGKAA